MDEVVNVEKEAKAKKASPEDVDEEKKDEIACRTIMGKNIIRTIFKPEQQKVNELFIAGRMAYVMDLEEDGETDIPTTSIRSKQDVINNEQKATLSTNDIVINKLTQILSYLRAGTRTKKKKKDKMGDLFAAEEDAVKTNVEVNKKDLDIPIYDDVGDYNRGRKEDKRDRKDERRDRGRDGDRKRDEKRERDRDRDRDRDKLKEGRDRDRHRDRDRDKLKEGR